MVKNRMKLLIEYQISIDDYIEVELNTSKNKSQ